LHDLADGAGLANFLEQASHIQSASWILTATLQF